MTGSKTKSARVSRRRAASGLALCIFGCAPYTPSTAHYPADWNHRQLEWRPYALGLREARRAQKPVVLVFYTDWCPHCHNYSRVFHDPRLIEASQRFVMIRVERDSNRELSQEYDVDGDYIPRTFLLAPNGELMHQLHTGRSEYRYFLNEYEPDELLELMHRAAELVETNAL